MLPHLNLAVVLLAYAAAPAVTQPLPLVSESTLPSTRKQWEKCWRRCANWRRAG